MLREVQSIAEKLLIQNCAINRFEDVYPNVPITCCFFHLDQSLYRKIQSEGLQEACNDPNDRDKNILAYVLIIGLHSRR